MLDVSGTLTLKSLPQGGKYEPYFPLYPLGRENITLIQKYTRVGNIYLLTTLVLPSSTVLWSIVFA